MQLLDKSQPSAWWALLLSFWKGGDSLRGYLWKAHCMCLACDLHWPLLGYDVHSLVSHVHCAISLWPQTLVQLQGKDRVVKGTLPCYSFGSGFGIDAWDSLGCPSLLALCLESLFWLMKSEPGPLLTAASTCDNNGMTDDCQEHPLPGSRQWSEQNPGGRKCF